MRGDTRTRKAETDAIIVTGASTLRGVRHLAKTVRQGGINHTITRQHAVPARKDSIKKVPVRWGVNRARTASAPMSHGRTAHTVVMAIRRAIPRYIARHARQEGARSGPVLSIVRPAKLATIRIELTKVEIAAIGA